MTKASPDLHPHGLAPTQQRTTSLNALGVETKAQRAEFEQSVLEAIKEVKSRRDRFLAGDPTSAVHTVPGLRWLADNTMTSVIPRHYPELRPAMRTATNAFTPWQRPGVRT